ncbi:phosphoglycerate kinase [Rhodopirellula europaea]|uniref:phosphoglycerate kinase n=1 Tax=Rhodopirellula europaea TaxID=1263866 RepID=UPI0030EC3A34
MGLDMYAYATTAKVDSPTDFEVEDYRLFHSWRRHPDLNDWMEALYTSKGGNKVFNCAAVVLTASDIDLLEKEVVNNRLAETAFLLFGKNDGCDIEDDLEFIAKARNELGNQRTVFYTAWW